MGSIRDRDDCRDRLWHCDNRERSKYHCNRSDARILEPRRQIVGDRLSLGLARSHILDSHYQREASAIASLYDDDVAGPTDDHNDVAGPTDDRDDGHHSHNAIGRSCYQSFRSSRARTDFRLVRGIHRQLHEPFDALQLPGVRQFWCSRRWLGFMLVGEPRRGHGGELVIRGYKDPAAVTASGCTTDANGLVTGGVKLTANSQTYGKYEVRMRIDNGQGVSLVALLWPTADTWPPEVDFTEDNGAAPRTLDTATEHWGTATNPLSVEDTLPVNLSQWHTVGVEWSPGKIVYTMDGTPWATETNANVPDMPMQLALQTEAWQCGAAIGNNAPTVPRPQRSTWM